MLLHFVYIPCYSKCVFLNTKLRNIYVTGHVRLRRKVLQSGPSLEQDDGGSSTNSLMLPDINPLETLRPRTHSGPSRNAKVSAVNLAEDRKKTLDDMVLKKSKHELYANKIPVVSFILSFYCM